MPTARTRETVTERIDLPPPYTLVRLRESGEAFAHALDIAEESGAGTLVYVGRFDLVEFAVVLEPTEPLRTARRAFTPEWWRWRTRCEPMRRPTSR